MDLSAELHGAKSITWLAAEKKAINFNIQWGKTSILWKQSLLQRKYITLYVNTQWELITMFVHKTWDAFISFKSKHKTSIMFFEIPPKNNSVWKAKCTNKIMFNSFSLSILLFSNVILEMISIFKLETYAKLGNKTQQLLFLSPSLSLFPGFIAIHLNAFPSTTKLNPRRKLIS